MNQNDNFQFVALAKLDLFAKSASGATWGYTRRRSFIFSAPLLITKSRKYSMKSSALPEAHFGVALAVDTFSLTWWRRGSGK
jgi:hypothetical protein